MRDTVWETLRPTLWETPRGTPWETPWGTAWVTPWGTPWRTAWVTPWGTPWLTLWTHNDRDNYIYIYIQNTWFAILMANFVAMWAVRVLLHTDTHTACIYWHRPMFLFTWFCIYACAVWVFKFIQHMHVCSTSTYSLCNIHVSLPAHSTTMRKSVHPPEHNLIKLRGRSLGVVWSYFGSPPIWLIVRNLSIRQFFLTIS